MATTSTLLVCPGGAWCFGIFHRALRTVKEYTETVERIHLNPVRRGLVRQPGMEMAKLSRVRRGERGGTATTLLMSTRGFEKPLLALRKRDRDQTAIQRRSAVSAFLSAS